MHDRDLEQAGRGKPERNSRDHVDVRIEDRRHHQHCPAKRADFGEPVVRRAPPAEHVAKHRLHRPGIFEEIGIGIGDDIGRDRRRQKQHPFEQATPGELVPCDDPGRADTKADRQHPDTGHQQQGVADIARQYGRYQMRPQTPAVTKGRHDKRRDRPEDQAADQNGGGRPAIKLAGRPARPT